MKKNKYVKCTRCQCYRPRSYYQIEVRKYNGLQSWCKLCNCWRKAIWQREQKNYLQKYRLSKGCMDCGYREHFAALQFDHVRGKKKIGLGETHGQPSRKRIDEEIAKCDVVCANCHFVREYKRMLKKWKPTRPGMKLFKETKLA